MIKLSDQKLYASLNEGVAVRDIQSAMKRIEYFKEFVENFKRQEVEENKPELIDFDKILDDKYGKAGTAEREEFHKKAFSYIWLHGEGSLLELPTFYEKKKEELRVGWAEAFAQYAEDGEDKMLLSDFIDNDGEAEL